MPKDMPKTAIAIAALALAVSLVTVFALLNASDGDGNTLLSYGISSDPNTIEITPKGAGSSLATLTVVASNNNPDPIYCDKIVFTIAEGDHAQSLTADTKGIVALATPSEEWQIARGDGGNFIATPKGDIANITIDDGLVFILKDITVNNKPGITTLIVTENSSKDNKAFSDKKGAFDLTKFPYGFYVKDFWPKKPMVKKGESVTLIWKGSGLAGYKISYDNTSVDVSNFSRWDSPGLNHDTTFTLEASAQRNGQNVTTYRTTTVTVADS